jgi:hypothetical protein
MKKIAVIFTIALVFGYLTWFFVGKWLAGLVSLTVVPM